jgi:hypothetical protein
MTAYFERELTNLLNRHSIDNMLNMPDYILAGHLVKYLKNLNQTLALRDDCLPSEMTGGKCPMESYGVPQVTGPHTIPGSTTAG